MPYSATVRSGTAITDVTHAAPASAAIDSRNVKLRRLAGRKASTSRITHAAPR